MKRIGLQIVFFILAASIRLVAQSTCECTNCPVPIENNAVAEAYLDVTVNGANNLAECPLEQVCFEITHSWIGDLSVSLTSPEGVRYLIMADIDNDTLGCGNSANNINVCVNVGTDNPLTNNTEYECNGPEFMCLNGDDWTVPCGGVTDPRNNAVQAPNCDLNDFNTEGALANGIWTLGASDICPWDVGFIETFSLVFACGADCFSCEADGGEIVGQNLIGCEGSPNLVTTAAPSWTDIIPDITDYSYTYLISQNNIILAHTNTLDFTTYPAGNYKYHGLSYHNSELDNLDNLIGLSIIDLEDTGFPFCANLSDNTFDINILGDLEATVIETTLCEGECLDLPDGTQCCGDTCSIILTSSFGCDSTVLYVVNFYETINTTVETTICEGDCLTLPDGSECCDEMGCELTFTAENGCDSIVTYTFNYYEPINTTVATTICEGDCLTLPDGSECCDEMGCALTFTAENGCDSIVTYTFDYYETINTTVETTICEGDCLTLPDGSECCDAAGCELVFTAENGCDSTVTYTFNYYENTPTTVQTELCPGQCLDLPDGTQCCGPDDCELTLTSSTGCDSTVIYTIIYTDLLEENVVANVCAGGCISINGNEYCAPNNYDIPLQTADGCDSLVHLTFNELTATVTIATPIALDCETNNVQLNGSASTGNYFQWTNAAGDILGNEATLNVSEALCYTLTVADTTGGNFCEVTSNICVQDNSEYVSEVMVFGETSICENTEITYTVSEDPNATSYIWTVPANVTIVAGGTPNATITVIWNNTIDGTICAAASNACGDGEATCLTIEVNTVPDMSAITGAMEACAERATTYCATGDAESYNWTIVGGEITSGNGTDCIIVIWNEDNTVGEVCVTPVNTCGEGSSNCMSIGILKTMSAIVTENCDLNTETFTVTIEITGGSGAYEATGTTLGSWNGNVFTSLPMTGETAYEFEITDGVCSSITVEGFGECMCTTFAGSLINILNEVCQDEIITTEFAISPTLDSNDIVQYIMHNGTAFEVGTQIFATNNAPEFIFMNGMQTGVMYYIAAIAGDNDNGNVDWNDPCFSISIGVPVTFLPQPDGNLTGETTICSGSETPMTLTLIGIPPFIAKVNGQDINVPDVLFSWDVAPTQTTDYTLQKVTDANGCSIDLDITTTIQVEGNTSAEVLTEAMLCNTNGAGDMHEINLNSLIISGNTNGVWSETTNSGATGTLPNLDFYGVIPGEYTFIYTLTSDNCPTQTYPVTITIENCTCPDGSFSSTALCNDNAIIDLITLQTETVVGEWSILAAPNGNNAATIAGTIFDATDADAGEYTLQFELTETPAPGCPTTWEATITVAAAVNAGTAFAPLTFCEGELIANEIDLTTLLEAETTGGIWTEISTNTSTNSAFNAANGTFDIAQQVAATYTFQYAVTGELPCGNDQTSVQIIINPMPIADAGEDQTLSCEQSMATIGGTTTTVGNGINYIWTSDNDAWQNAGNVPTFETSLAGTYTLTATNEFGCSATSQVTIDGGLAIPNPAISLTPISCHDEMDGAIIVESVTGGEGPYVYSLDGENFTDNPNFTNLEPGIYTLVVEDANGCSNTLIFNIEQPQEMQAIFSASVQNGNEIVLGESVDLSILINIPEEDITNITWTQGAEWLDCDTCLNVVATPIETTTFSVTIESNECSVTEVFLVVVKKEDNVFVPDAFSPNGDGNNDVLHVFAGQDVKIVNNFMIFTRWGESIFQATEVTPNNPTQGWDGRHRGRPLNVGVYVWFAEVEFIDGRVEIFEGDVTLIR